MNERYSRQILFKEIGRAGQKRIRRRGVAVIGAGALGSAASEMLVRAGVGRLVVVDRDYVDETNLQRQSLFDEESLERNLPKAVAATERLRHINHEVDVEGRVMDVHGANVEEVVDGFDLILDGTDNFETRYVLNDACVKKAIPWIYAACVGSYGMSFVVRPGVTPCLRCFMEDEPPPGTSPTCDTAGIIAPVVHAVVAFQVTEALKILAGREDALLASVFSVDVWSGKLERFQPSSRRKDCPTCGRREFRYLESASESQAVTLCGRNAVQVRPGAGGGVELGELARRLRAQGQVVVNPHLLRFETEGKKFVLFADGRAIIHGTEDTTEARSLYARFIGL